jgi:hypothetical protein
MDTSIVSDDDWQRWANELQYLQEIYPEPIGFYDEVFKDWDGTTGMHLPKDDWVRDKAQQLLTNKDK